VPLTGEALHLVGQPSRVGSVFARAFGWIVIGAGLSIALGIGAVASLLQWPLVVFGIAAPVAVVSLIAGGLLLRGGKHLDQQGAAAEKSARSRAVLALAAQRGGTLTAQDVSASLNVTPEVAEEILQSLAKEQYETIAVDVALSAPSDYDAVTACLRGPDLFSETAEVQRMLGSLSLAGGD